MADTPPDILVQFAKALGMDEATATPEAILTSLGTRLGDATKATTERDAAVAEAAKVKTEREAERIDAALSLALGKSGIIAQNSDDAAAILRGVLEVNKDGRVVTKTAPNVVPGQTAEQYIMGQLRTLRPHYWPVSAGGGAKGGGITPTGVDVSCFKPGGRLTDQMALVGLVGEKAAIDSCRRAGVAPPPWLKGGR